MSESTASARCGQGEGEGFMSWELKPRMDTDEHGFLKRKTLAREIIPPAVGLNSYPCSSVSIRGSNSSSLGHSQRLLPRFARARPKVPVAMVVVADALFAQIPEQFNAAFGQHRLVSQIDALLSGGRPHDFGHAVGRGVANPLIDVWRQRPNVLGE